MNRDRERWNQWLQIRARGQPLIVGGSEEKDAHILQNTDKDNYTQEMIGYDEIQIAI